MSDEPTPASPDSSSQNTFGRRVGTGLAGETTRNDGSTILPEANPRPIEVIGDFEVIGKLGQGGMGAVYRARQVSLDRQVALKILPSHYEADPDYVARFQREARVAASLSHPNLVKVYASGLANGSHYIAMELVEGETLSQWLKRGALPPLEALRITLDVTRALDCGWRTAQLIHRDIKPGNIFLSIHGEVKLGDLGLAKSVGSDTTGLTHTGMAMGTPHYISPEQARGDKDLDFRADIYSLGCTLYQMLTRQTPYSGTEPMVVMNQHINAPPPAILKVMPQCPLPLGRLVSKMMKKARRERPTSYEELIAAIESVRAQLDPSLAAPAISSPVQDPTPIPPAADAGPISQRAPRKSKLPIYACIGAVVLAVVTFFLWPKQEMLTKAELYAHDHAAELKAAADAKAALAGATKDAPFTNTLGMKFVPVPILDGPTGGQRVLFSVWDTRVQDYEVFVKETKREWPKVGFKQGPMHPVVRVDWNDAHAFCAWLTERERQAGKLGANEVYRLPTDHEWSCAAGLGEWEDPAKLPMEKSQKVGNIFPWGTQWPPPENAGNFASEELRPLLAVKYTWLKGVIDGYHDGFAETSPVGSFPANQFGLYDLGGNVGQWCEDWYEKEQKTRVVRGPSWTAYSRGALVSSFRSQNRPDNRFPENGFRCVLARASTAPSAGTATGFPTGGGQTDSAALESGAIRLWDTPEKVAPHLGTGFVWNDGVLRLDGRGADYFKLLSRDAILRCAIRMNPDSVHLRVQVRCSKDSKGKSIAYFLELNSVAGLLRLVAVNEVDRILHDWKLSRAYSPDDWLQLELRVVGDELTVSADGTLLGTVRDGSITQPGGVQLFASANGYFRDIVYVPLDQTDTSAPRPASLSPSTESWQDVLHDPAKLTLNGGAERTPEGLRLPDKHAEARYHRAQGPAGDGAIRMLATFGGLRPELHIGGGASVYRLTAATDGKSVAMLRYDGVNKQSFKLGDLPLREPLQSGQDYELELRVVGQTFTAKLNGEILGTVTDGGSAERGFSVGAVDAIPDPALVKALEVLDLAPPGGKP